MANDPKFSLTATGAALDAISLLLDSGGYLRIYASGSSPPSTADAAIAGTLLAQLTLNSDFAAAASGTERALTANAITSDSSADNGGTADYFRLWKSDGTTCIFQGTAGASSCDLNLSPSAAITAGAAVACSSLVLTLPRE